MLYTTAAVSGIFDAAATQMQENLTLKRQVVSFGGWKWKGMPGDVQVYQTGDLANMDGLEPELASKLPTLLEVRNAVYSQEFRTFVEQVWRPAVTHPGMSAQVVTCMQALVYSVRPRSLHTSPMQEVLNSIHGIRHCRPSFRLSL